MASSKPTPYAFAPTKDGKKLPWELGKPDNRRLPTIPDSDSPSSTDNDNASSSTSESVSGFYAVGQLFEARRQQRQADGGGGRDVASEPLEETQQEEPNPILCRCGNCPAEMPTAAENKCCMTENFTTTFLKDFENGKCIINCEQINHIFNSTHLEICWLAQRQYQGFRGPALNFSNMDNRNYRHHGYRSYIMLMHGKLGQYQRRVVPACLVTHLRNTYPDTYNQYKGFVAVNEDGEEILPHDIAGDPCE